MEIIVPLFFEFLNKLLENGNTGAAVLVVVILAVAWYAKKNGETFATDGIKTIVTSTLEPVLKSIDDVKESIVEVKASVVVLDDKLDKLNNRVDKVDIDLAVVKTAVSIHHSQDNKLF